MKFYISILYCFLFFTSDKAFSAEENLMSTEEYAHSNEWLKYLHYDGDTSSIKAISNFFISPTGNVNPTEELKASLDVFRDPSNFLKKGIGHPNCLFPARLTLLSRKFDLKTEPINCPALKRWREDAQSDELKIVLAAQFVNNPASVMGHTFLKFQDNKNDYLSLYVGFAANVTDNVGVLEYVIKGIGGGFNGTFTTGPYYQKIYEYNSIEERDMWEFTLDLSDEERNLINDHIWELKNTAQFSYYFFSKNCSYILNEIINIAKPNLNLLIGSFYVVPHEAVKKISENSLIKDIKYIPSSRNKLLGRYNTLTQSEKKIVLSSIDKKRVDENSSLDVLDTFIDYNLLNDQRLKKKNEGHGSVNEFTNEVLRKRASIFDNGRDQFPPPSKTPLDAHAPRNISFSYLNDFRKEHFLNFEFHPGIHKLMDSSNGFIPNSSFDFMSFNFSYGIDDKNGELSKFNLINISNINSYSRIDPIMSWGFKLFYENQRLTICEECKNVSAQMNYGPTFPLMDDLVLITSVQIALMKNFDEKEKIRVIAPGMMLSFILEKEKYKILLSENVHQDIRKNVSDSVVFEGEFKLRFYEISKNYDLEVGANHFSDNKKTASSFTFNHIYQW